MTTATPEIGSEIQRRREAAGLRREDLASRAGISYATLERTEQGKTKPRRATLAVIEAVLDEEEAA